MKTMQSLLNSPTHKRNQNQIEEESWLKLHFLVIGRRRTTVVTGTGSTMPRMAKPFPEAAKATSTVQIAHTLSIWWKHQRKTQFFTPSKTLFTHELQWTTPSSSGSLDVLPCAFNLTARAVAKLGSLGWYSRFPRTDWIGYTGISSNQ